MTREKNSTKSSFNSEKLRKWFFLNRRALPWRENPSPYEVWVSEVMLQQTQVSVVIPYFKKWMERFPTISSLAVAPIEMVIKAWEGLGYYSRARNLKKGAEYLCQEHGGELPDNYSVLQEVKGLGPYIIGAILSFAFKKKFPAVDGNVLRVLSRFFAIEDPIDKGKTQKRVREICLSILPDDEPWIIMEALIELGALVCQKKAKCHACPLSHECLGKSKADLLPNKSKREKTVHLHRDVAVIYSGTELLLQKGNKGKVMADLWEFPYFDRGSNIEDILGISLTPKMALREMSHGFTKYKAFLYPYLYEGEKTSLLNYLWIPFGAVMKIPFSSGHRRIIHYLRNNSILNI
ncbi:MAG: A/G-specific adenine glycosylase [Candidatus Neptunochlamydia sp.]|nr:A/G-specific adenine glycosylase [Candidatus Neptunochlamydia sp.]